jgi:hypothetical protein
MGIVHQLQYYERTIDVWHDHGSHPSIFIRSSKAEQNTGTEVDFDFCGMIPFLLIASSYRDPV